MTSGRYVCWFTGGKDSSWTLYKALEAGLDVGRLVTVDAKDESEFYHVPETEMISLAASATGIELEMVPATYNRSFDDESELDSGINEMWALEGVLAELDEAFDGGIAGICAGTVENEPAASIIEREVEKQGLELFTPLWRTNHFDILREMVNDEFEIRFSEMDVSLFDESWLGEPLDHQKIDELIELREDHDFHPLGENNEFETIVTDGPHMETPMTIESDGHAAVEYPKRTTGEFRRLEITDIHLA